MTKSAAASHRERTNRNDVDFLINNNKILFFNNVTELKKHKAMSGAIRIGNFRRVAKFIEK